MIRRIAASLLRCEMRARGSCLLERLMPIFTSAGPLGMATSTQLGMKHCGPCNMPSRGSSARKHAELLAGPVPDSIAFCDCVGSSGKVADFSAIALPSPAELVLLVPSPVRFSRCLRLLEPSFPNISQRAVPLHPQCVQDESIPDRQFVI